VTRIAVVPRKTRPTVARHVKKAKTKTKATPIADGREKTVAVKAHGRGPADHPVKKPHPVTPAPAKAKPPNQVRVRPKGGKKLGQQKPPKPEKKAKPPAKARADAEAPAEAHGRGPKKPPSDPGSSGTAPAGTAYPVSPAS
jgi:hypothetical protein